MSNRKLYLAAYDIADDKRLRDFLTLLRGYSSGGQKSVFECWLSHYEKTELVQNAQLLMVAEEDRFLLLSMDKRQKVKTMGKAVKPVDNDWYYIG